MSPGLLFLLVLAILGGAAFISEWRHASTELEAIEQMERLAHTGELMAIADAVREPDMTEFEKDFR